MIRFWNAFVKITGWPVQLLCFRTRMYYSDRERQGRRIKGPAILISNHTSVFDYAVWLFVFFSRTLRYQMAELLFRKKPLGTLLRLLGGIYVDRDARDMGFIAESERILEKGGVVGIFPESRLPRKGEERPLPFAPSAAYLALTTGAQVIPAYTDGAYFSLSRRARVMIGTPFFAADLAGEGGTDRERIARTAEAMRGIVKELGNELERQKSSAVRG